MKYWNKRVKGIVLICISLCLYGFMRIKETKYMYYLKEELWVELSKDERVDVLRYIKDEQLDQLEVDYVISLSTANLEGNTVGSYSHTNKTILIDEYYLMNKTAKEAVSVICHEAYHAYQYHLIDYYNSLDELQKDIPAYNVIEKYMSEFDDYVDEGDEYFNQKVEVDAREYASLAIKHYQF